MTAVALLVAQIAVPPRAEAASLGSSTASAGSATPPTAAAIHSFQPDLFTGRATTSIPIAVPPGRKGMQPSFGLTYSSSGRNSWVGVGWSLDVGYIERSTKNGVPKYDTSDAFSFMFQGVASDLVKIPDGTYRAKDEGLFLRFENHGVSGWEVRDKSGTRYLFGETAASQIENVGNAFRWCLDKIIDVNGNSLSITYTKDQGQLYLSQILYTAYESTGPAPANEVDFTPESRSDIDVSYRSGFAVTTAKRLKTIDTKTTVGTTLSLARRYVLGYTSSARTQRSLLTSITQIGTDGTTSLPPMTFAYQDGGALTYSMSRNNPSVSKPTWNVQTANIDLGHDNFGALNPYAGLPWNSPQTITGPTTLNLGCVSVVAGSDGSIQLSGCQDNHVHVWTYLYVPSSTSLSLSSSGFGCDSNGSYWREDASGLTQVSPSGFSLAAGWSILHITDYHQHDCFGLRMSSPLLSMVNVMSASQFLKPQLAGDTDGNGTTDLITFDTTTGTWSVSSTQPSAISPADTWLSGFGNSSSIPVVGDWNGDGLTDIAIVNSGTWRFATSSSSSFRADALPSVNLGSGTPFTGDFNGDGIIDIGTYNNGSWSIFLGTGSGFASAGSFSFSWGSGSSIPLIGDFNGDGLTDIARVDGGSVSVALSNGTSFLPQSSAWIAGFGSGNYTTADFNGDGITDVGFYDKSTGQIQYAASTGTQFGSPTTLPAAFSLRSTDDNVQVGDFNGDGFADPGVFNPITGSAELTNSKGDYADLLQTITNGVGGTTTITYQPSSQLTNAFLPFVVPVVNRVVVSDGLGQSYSTTYTYSSGFYDVLTKEFRGFAHVEVRDAEANVTSTDFYQDEQKKGRPFHTDVRDAMGNLWTKQEQTWSDVDPYPGVHFVKLDQTDSFIYDGDATFRQTRSRFEYDAYGNVIATHDDGEPTVTGDERSTATTYVTNTTAWILNKPSLVQTLDANGVVVAQRRFSYDGAADTTTAPTKGNLTKEEEWLNLPTLQWLATSLTYDAYGNVATVTDVLTRTTTNSYDANGTYLIKIANALGHTRQLAYDPRFGQVTSSTDQNGVTTSTQYDALGRVTSVIGPNDTSALPTISYEYAPASPISTTITHTRIQSGQPGTLTAYAFTDGLGRTIQTRSPAEDSAKQIVGGAVELNARGLVVKQWVSYLDATSSSYVPASLVSGLTSPISYTYDPLGRVITTTEPDGSITSTRYDDWSVTVTDANSHQTRRTNDAFGRLATVDEFTDGQTYTTTYQYDALNNLTKVTDAKGNVTTIAYDSLGRKLSMDDPDMHHWAYAYDAVDNLTAQTDARGVITSFTYDALNRLTQKSYTIPTGSTIANPGAVTYTYDGTNDTSKLFTKGKLTKITDGSGSSAFEYDNLGRLVKESKTIDSTTYTIQRSYDLLGRLTSLTYPDNEVTTYIYNAQGGIETVNLQPTTGIVQPIVTDIDYNAAGQLTKITYGNGTSTDYSYNPLTLRLDHLQTSGTSGTLQDFRYTFDPLGNVTQIQDSVHTATQTFEYDGLSRLTKAIGAYGALTYAYDPIGNMLEKEGVMMAYGESGAGAHAVTSTSAGWAMQYDANGNMIQKVIDARADMKNLTTQLLKYDAENRLTEVKTAQDTTMSVTFKPGWNFFSLPVIPDDGTVVTILPSFAQNFEQVTKFDSATNTFKHCVGNAKFDDFSTLDYGVGYQIYVKGTSDLTVSFKGKLPTQPLSKSLTSGWFLLPSLTLDSSKPVSWLTTGLDADQVLAYDQASSSLKTVTTLAPGVAYYVHLRTASTFSPSLPRDPTTTFIYDGDGGRVKQITPVGVTKFLGQSFEIAPDGTTTKYLFAGSQRIASIEIAPGQVASLPHEQLPSVFAKVWRALASLIAVIIPDAEAAIPPSAMKFYLTDHLGSSNLITDGTGAVVELAEHSPYGSLARHDGPANVPYKFTGQRQDSGTGLILFPARPYDPQLGRFTQPDSFVQDPSDPQTLNRYSYVRNNPLNLVDPSGYSWKLFLKILGIVAAAVAVVATAGAALGAAPAVAAVIGEGVSLGTIASTAGWVATGSLVTSSLLPGPSSGPSPPTTAAIMASAATIASGGLAPAALLGSAALQAGIGYAGSRLLESPIAQKGIGRTARALERFGVSPRAAVILSSLVAGMVVFGALSSGVSAGRAVTAATLSEDTIPAGYRLVAPRGAINAPVEFTKPGETFVRVSANPRGLNFSFKSPGGVQGGTYAFPEEEFLKFQNNPLTIKYFGDLPGEPPTVYGRITPPTGTPIQRGIVPGGQFGGAGGAQEVYFPDEF